MRDKSFRSNEYKLPEYISKLPLDDTLRRIYEQHMHERRLRHQHLEAMRRRRRHDRVSAWFTTLLHIVAGVMIPLVAVMLLGIVGLGIVGTLAAGILFAGILAGVGPDSQREITPDQMIASFIAFMLCLIFVIAIT